MGVEKRGKRSCGVFAHLMFRSTPSLEDQPLREKQRTPNTASSAGLSQQGQKRRANCQILGPKQTCIHHDSLFHLNLEA